MARRRPSSYQVNPVKGARRRRKVAELIKRDGRGCCFCGGLIDMGQKAPHPKSLTIEHTTPLCEGGTNALENLKLAHWKCNNDDAKEVSRRVDNLRASLVN